MMRELMERAARAAGDIAMRYFRKEFKAEYKPNDQGLVTQADTEAEEAIRTILAPTGYAFLGEESGLDRSAQKTWVVDPIDGTNNFGAGIPFFCVSIALKEGEEFTHGVVYDPSRDEMFYAGPGTGLLIDGVKHGWERHFQPIVLVDTVFRELPAKEAYAMMANMAEEFPKQRSLAACALSMAWVAAGRAHVFVGYGMNQWDYGAGIVLAKEAGLRATDWSKDPIRGKEVLLAPDDLYEAIRRYLVERPQQLL